MISGLKMDLSFFLLKTCFHICELIFNFFHKILLLLEEYLNLKGVQLAWKRMAFLVSLFFFFSFLSIHNPKSIIFVFISDIVLN